ncbi:hypothetical protein ACHHYP_08179 [Achlya hypogyna]|uniref:Uncharacterized protein n=1 Tax=Achlya hypogyna TaxID=1202772 RepID=A0A1V9YPH4_ACHHY|nr:hypothetical protein ACHHYP_08179 [Achlya hypogyna]
MFAHRVRLPGPSSMVVPPAARPRSASVELRDRDQYPALRGTSASLYSRLPSLEEDEVMQISYVAEEDDGVPYVDRTSISTTVLSWEDVEGGDVEIVNAHDAYSPLSRLSDIYKLQHALTLHKPTTGRYQRSYSCSTLQDTLRKVAQEFLQAWRLRARASAMAPVELQLIEWAHVIFSYEAQIYDDRCLRTSDTARVRTELQHVSKRVDALLAKLQHVHTPDRVAKHQVHSVGSHLLDRIQKILADVAGTHHCHRSGRVDYMQL